MRLALFTLLAGVSFSLTARTLEELTISNDTALLSLSDDVTVAIRLLPYNSIEVEYRDPDETNLPGLALAPSLNALPPSKTKTADGFRLSHGAVGVRITRAPFNLAFDYHDETRLKEASGYFSTATLRGFRFKLTAQEALYGGGQRVLGMDRRGHRMPLYNRAHYGYTTESKQMYYSLPAVLSSQHYAVLFDNTAKGSLDIGASEADILQFSAQAGRSAYIVTLGNSTKDVSTNVVQLTGTQPLPPRWALGNFASRFGYRNEQQTRDVVTRFADENMPLDAVVLDLYWFGKDVKGHMGNLEWDTDAFPSPDAMIADFKKQNIQTVLITEPFILTSSSKYQAAASSGALASNLAGEPRTFDFFFGNTALVDVFSDAGRQWFSSQYQRLLSHGVAGFWGDLGEPEVHPEDTLHTWQGKQVTADEIHNAYGHKWAELVYTTLIDAQPDTRPFLLMRSGFLGSQRFGMIPWTGDVSRSWGGLKPQVELALQMSVFGLAYTHSDLGGFAGGEQFDPELYIRWLQLGEFQPVFRPHAQEDIAPEPVFHDDTVKNAARRILQRRYQMLPYNYSLLVENSKTGMPLMRPLSFYHPQPQWFDNARSFYWGPSVLVSPVTEPGVDTWDVTLPPGQWFARHTGRQVEGGTTVSVDAALTHIPVFIKNGAIIPMINPINNTAAADFSELHVHVWAAEGVKESAFRYYEDDGLSRNTQNNQQYHIDFAVTENNAQLILRAAGKGHYSGRPTNRTLVWHVHGLESPGSTGSGANLTVRWNEDNKVLTVRQPFSQKARVTLSR